jgi:hypothetical protein
MSVFHGLLLGKTGQPPTTGLPAKASAPVAPGGEAPPGEPSDLRTATRTFTDFAQRLRRHGLTR